METIRDEVRWYPMRVTYNQELKVKSNLDSLNIDNYVPMHFEIINESNKPRRKLVPAIHNLIFIHSTQNIITDLKQRNKNFEPLRYMMRRHIDGKSEIMHVPDIQMESFMRVASASDENVMFLECKDFMNKIGKKVEITAGIFKGVRGVIKRIKKNKHVVVQIEGVAAVAISYVPPCYLKEIV